MTPRARKPVSRLSEAPLSGRVPDPAQATSEILQLCRELGFALAGVAPAEPSEWAGEMERWLQQGRQGEMGYLTEAFDVRRDIRKILDGGRSVIMVADLYCRRGTAPDTSRPQRGRLARYVRGRDYHGGIKRRLHRMADTMRARYPGCDFRSFTDTAPVLEREQAVRCGLGWLGRNTMLINPTLGSYVLLGGAVTTLELAVPPGQQQVPDFCGTCTRCIDACPTQAITPLRVDAARCISYLTIEHRSRIDPALQPAVGDWLFGCDICQEVCPHNTARPPQVDVGRVHPSYSPRHDGFDLLEVLNWNEADRRAAFQVSALKRATLAMIKRNALVSLAAGGASALSDAACRRIRELAADPSEHELVRQTAAAIAETLDRPPGTPGGGR